MPLSVQLPPLGPGRDGLQRVCGQVGEVQGMGVSVSMQQAVVLLYAVVVCLVATVG